MSKVHESHPTNPVICFVARTNHRGVFYFRRRRLVGQSPFVQESFNVMEWFGQNLFATIVAVVSSAVVFQRLTNFMTACEV